MTRKDQIITRDILTQLPDQELERWHADVLETAAAEYTPANSRIFADLSDLNALMIAERITRTKQRELMHAHWRDIEERRRLAEAMNH